MEPEAGPRDAASAAVPAGGTAEVTSDKKKSLNWLDDQRRRMRQGGFPLAYADAPPRDTFARASHLLRWLASDPDDAAGYVGISSGGQGLLALLGTASVPSRASADQKRYFMGITQWVFFTDRGLVQSLVPLSVGERTEDLLKPLLSPPPDLITAYEWLLWVNLRLGLRRRTEVDSILQPWLLSRQNQVLQERKDAAMRGLAPATPVGAAALPASARAMPRQVPRKRETAGNAVCKTTPSQHPPEAIWVGSQVREIVNAAKIATADYPSISGGPGNTSAHVDLLDNVIRGIVDARNRLARTLSQNESCLRLVCHPNAASVAQHWRQKPDGAKAKRSRAKAKRSRAKAKRSRADGVKSTRPRKGYPPRKRVIARSDRSDTTLATSSRQKPRPGAEQPKRHLPECWPRDVVFTNAYIFGDRPALPRKPQCPSSSVQLRWIRKASHPCVGQRGVFAAGPVATDQWLMDYTGRVMPRTASETAGCNRYLLPLWDGRGEVTYDIDAAKCGNESRFINDYRGTGAAPNIVFVPYRLLGGTVRIAVRTCRPVAAGEELLADYGEEYWTALEKFTKGPPVGRSRQRPKRGGVGRRPRRRRAGVEGTCGPARHRQRVGS